MLHRSKIVVAAAAAIILAHTVACTRSSPSVGRIGPKRVVTTFTILQDMAQNVAGDKAIVESITKPGAEIHEYEPTPLDIVKAQKADLILWNGFNLERWFEKFFGN